MMRSLELITSKSSRSFFDVRRNLRFVMLIDTFTISGFFWNGFFYFNFISEEMLKFVMLIDTFTISGFFWCQKMIWSDVMLIYLHDTRGLFFDLRGNLRFVMLIDTFTISGFFWWLYFYFSLRKNLKFVMLIDTFTISGFFWCQKMMRSLELITSKSSRSFFDIRRNLRFVMLIDTFTISGFFWCLFLISQKKKCWSLWC